MSTKYLQIAGSTLLYYIYVYYISSLLYYICVYYISAEQGAGSTLLYAHVVIILCICPHTMRWHTCIYMSSYYYISAEQGADLSVVYARTLSLSLSLHTHTLTQSKELIGVLFTRELVVKTWNNFIAQRAPTIGSLKRQVQEPRAIYVSSYYSVGVLILLYACSYGRSSATSAAYRCRRISCATRSAFFTG